MSEANNAGEKPSGEKPSGEKPSGEKPSGEKPAEVSTGIQARSTMPEPLPSAAEPAAAPAKPRRPHFAANQLDRGLVILVVVFAFLLGSFAARNSDLVMSLATGRLIANGEYKFGVDPFTYTAKDALWVNHSWLFDWGMYSLYNAAGEAGPIVFKAIVLVLLALILVGIHRREQTLWVPTICVALAMLVMSPRFLMQSTCLSFLFLGITVYLLTAGRWLWLLPPLFALWVNCDQWFVLGPLTVLLFLCGSLAQRLARGQRRGARGQGREMSSEQRGVSGAGTSNEPVPSPLTPGPSPLTPRLAFLILAIGLAACLINPFHYRAFILPPELGTLIAPRGDVEPSSVLAGGKTVRILERDFGSPGVLWGSPLNPTWRQQTGLGRNVAGLSYFLLLSLCLGSFVLPAVRDLRAFPWQRFLPWLFFAFLSLLQIRVIPFFAIVSAPVLILNVQDFYAERLAPARVSVRRRPLLGRLLTVAVFLVLLFLAWPGWLHGRIYPFDFHAAHRVAWKIDFDPSLRRAAERLGELKNKTLLKNVFTASPELTCYCAWFAPQVKGFIDFRHSLFPQVAGKFIRTKQALAAYAKDVLEGKAPDRGLEPWRELVKEYDVNCLGLTGFLRLPQPTRLVGLCWLDDRHWSWLYGDGRTEIFGWNDRAGRFAGRTLSLSRAAFGDVAEAMRAPPDGINLPDGETYFWERYLHGAGGVALDLDTAEQYQLLPKILSDRGRGACIIALNWGVMNGPVALNAAAPAGVTAPAAIATYYLPGQIFPMPSPPPATPLLTMRAARRAAAENPLNADVYSMLARAGEALWRQQENRWAPFQPFQSVRQNMRQIQVIAAWKAHLRLDPDDPRAHYALFQIYWQMHYLDVAAEHLKEAARTWQLQPIPADARKQQRQEQQRLEKDYHNLEAEVKKRQDDFALGAVRLSPLQKFVMAVYPQPYRRTSDSEREQVDPQGFGLARKAQEAFDKARLGQLSEQEKVALFTAQLNLLLRLGEIGPVSERVAKGPGLFSQRFFCAVARGDYAQADRDLNEQIAYLAVEKQIPRLIPSLLLSLRPPVSVPDLAASATIWYRDGQQHAADLLKTAAEFHLLRGLLLLERGDTQTALQQFQESLRLVGNTIFLPDKPIAEHYIELLKDSRKAQP